MKIKIITSVLLFVLSLPLYADKPYRVGTATADFLEMGIGGAANAMGQAQVAATRDMNSIYWNAAGLAYMEKNEAVFTHQPWVADISVNFVGTAFVLPRIGTLGLGITNMNFGRIGVTTLDMQEGTGETYQANEFAASFSYARKLAEWFAFGASAKYIASNIWHMSAHALAMDLGVIVNTNFFSFTGKRQDGLSIGMSISNYGTRMRYDGMDLLRPIDILPDANGNYKDVEGQFRLQQWELPLVLRLGVALYPIVTRTQKLTLAVDALHPNNNCESVNVGGEYSYFIPGAGSFFLRGGYRGIFMEKSEYGVTLGAGIAFTLMGNNLLKLDYAFNDIGMLGNSSIFSIALTY